MRIYLLIISFLIIFIVTPLQAGYTKIELMNRIPLVPYPKTLNYKGDKIPFPKAISIIGLSIKDNEQKRTIETLDELFDQLLNVTYNYDGNHPFKIQFLRKENISNKEGYELISTGKGITIYAVNATGEFYAAQTLYQILAFSYWGCEMLDVSEIPAEKDAAVKRFIPLLEIKDEPQLQARSVMLDLGRATFTIPYIKNIIKIIAHLKMNMLHLHLYDDELNGFRFSNSSLGEENPFAINSDELKEIVNYARSFHVTIIPELESWGHVGSILYHYPELFGAIGMWGGYSFGIGEKTFDLLEKMYEDVLLCLEDDAIIHVGLDEATWAVLPGEEDKDYTPTKLVGKIYDILMKLAKKHNKKITMYLWADHGGRPLPERIENKVVIQPWKYKESDKSKIIETLKKYGGENKTLLMMGGGISSACYSGDYGATRIWCQQGVKYPNVLGINICIWGTNDIAGRIISLYGGADFAWSPETPKLINGDNTGEDLKRSINRKMRKWQAIFPEASSKNLNKLRGEETFLGKYVNPPMSFQPVAPTVNFRIK